MCNEDYITLKWGTLKSWRITSKKGATILNKYNEIGHCISAAFQKDTKEQKELLCDLVDTVPGEIYLDWDGIDVSKSKAKEYIMNYGKED